MSYGCSTIPPCGRSSMTKRKRAPGGGAVLDSYRSGTRAEYLALYGLSRFCFVNQVPRQEDFGIADFFCTLGKRREAIKRKKKHYLIYPENSFYVQVKANKNTYELNSRVIEWLASHISNPFFICVVNQKSNKLSFYNPTLIWAALAIRPNSAGVNFFFDKKRFEDSSGEPIIHHDNMHMIGKGKRAKFNIYLGPPIFEQSLSFLENDKTEEAYNNLKPHITSELKIIWTHRLIGPTISVHLIDSKEVRGVFKTDKYSTIENSIKNTLLALLNNYANNRQLDKLYSLSMYLVALGITDFKQVLRDLNYDDEIINSLD